MPKRLFAFGCSFTNYYWMSWPQIVAAELQAELYNYGRLGAGNHYIFNHVMQADAVYNFTPDDLVIVCWTNVYREDRYVFDKWHVTGNISTSNIYDQSWVEKWVDPRGCSVRDFAMIKSVDSMLAGKNCNYKFFSMCNIVDQYDQFLTEQNYDNRSVYEVFETSLNKIATSFFETCWNNDIENKRQKDFDLIGNYIDGHPSPLEHLEYIEKNFSAVSDDTRNKVLISQDRWINFMQEQSRLDRKSVV